MSSDDSKRYPCLCSDCGIKTTVPFKPTEGRDVYCKECLPKHPKPKFGKTRNTSSDTIKPHAGKNAEAVSDITKPFFAELLELKQLSEGTNSKTIIPIHTEHADHFDKMHNNVKKVNLNETMEFMK